MPVASAVSSQIASDVRSRGNQYYRTQRVSLLSVDATEVMARVRGSRNYDVDLTLEGPELRTSCTCPYVDGVGSACKHIWATILAADGRGFGQSHLGKLNLTVDLHEEAEADDDDEDDDDRYESYDYSPRSPSPRRVPAPLRETWKDQFAAVTRELAPTGATPAPIPAAEQQLMYVIDIPACTAARKLTLEIATRVRKTNGEWGRPKSARIAAHQVEQLADPLDRQLLALLGGAQRSNGYGYPESDYSSPYGVTRYHVSRPLLEAVLPPLAQTGRVHLRTDPKQPALPVLTPELDSPWELAAAITRDEAGTKWLLAGRLQRGDETLPLDKPDLVVPGLVVWDGRFARLNDGGAFAWVPILRRVKTIAAPMAATDEFLGRLFQMPRLPQLDVPEELRCTEERVVPRPRLAVKTAKRRYGPSFLEATLSFVYDGQIVPALPFNPGILLVEAKRFLIRDAEAERQASQALARLGMRPNWVEGRQALEVRPNQLPNIVRELTTAGWLVEAEGKLYRHPGAFELAVRTERDWFDLAGSADFEGKVVPLPRLLSALRQGISSIVLDDGSVGMLPEDWLKKYGLIARMGTVAGDSVRFSRAQIGVLDALLAARPEVTFDKQFARAREELRKFSGIAACDPPASFQGELRAYQCEGLGWLRFLRKFGFGGCLADDMGLGKTVQVLALLAGRRTGPALVVVPRSLVFNWKQEAARFAPRLKVLDHTGTTRDRSGASFADYDLVVTTYGTLRNDAATFAGVRFDTCVLDESQAAKNADTETAKAVRLVQADHRLALSGTPVENHLGELWTLFDFLNPGMLGRAALFGGEAGSARNPSVETRELLAKALRPFILRRTKDQVAKDLPAKTEQTVYCDLEPEQRRLYDELRDHYRQSLLARVDSVGLGRSKIQVLEALLRLRQAACHPGLIDEKRVGEDSAKLDVLMPQLQEIAEEGHKTLVFSQFTSFLDIVRKRLDAEGLTYEYLDGKTRDRAARVERFQTDPECRLFLVSLKAGGVGLNLTAAEYVFLLDPWWNPAVEAQAIDRSHRIGQTKPVFAYRIIARGTVEEKVLALQQSKRELADAILGGDGRLITDLKREDLELLLS